MAKLITLTKLANFKTKQDAANANKFMQINDFVDGEGKIKAEKISSENAIIKFHVDSTDAGNIKYFADNDGVKSETEIAGEIGKIYIDLATNCQTIYTFDGENFIPFAASIATDEDINSLFE